MMTYNRVNNSISEAYTSIYNKSQKRYVTESAKERDLLKGYKPLLELVRSDEQNLRKFLYEVVSGIGNDKLYDFLTRINPSLKSKYEKVPSRSKLWKEAVSHCTTSSGNEAVKDFLPLLNSEEVVNRVKNALNTDIDIPIYKDSTATTTINGDDKPAKKPGDRTTTTTPDSGKDGQPAPAENNQKEKVKKVSIPADIDSDTINYYKGELDKIAKKSMRLRERILTIIRLQSEYIERFRNQNANQTAQYQQQTAGNGGTVTKGTVFLQGQQNPNTHQHVQPQQPQQPQQQPQNTPKQDEEEDGIFSKAMKGLGKAVGGVVGGGADIGSAALDAGKSGLGYLKRGADYLMGK